MGRRLENQSSTQKLKKLSDFNNNGGGVKDQSREYDNEAV